MSTAATGRRRRGPGRLDPTVRGLLRTFLSPAVADRYASALQPIAVADRDAALAGAVTTLRARFFVLPEELAVALVEHAGWSVPDVSTMLGLPTMEVRAALREAAGASEPRVGTRPPVDLDEVDDEVAAIEAMLAGLPAHRREAAAEDEADEEDVDTELSTTLPTGTGFAALEERVRRADRLQRLVVTGTIVTVLVLVSMTLNATRPGEEVALPEGDTVAVEPSPPRSAPSPTPTASPSRSPTPTPTASPSPQDELPAGPPVLDAARFVASVDPSTGEPGPALDSAGTSDDPRLWLRFSRMPAQDLLLRLTFTAPSGRATVRPVLVTDRIPLVSVRLPDELGRAPGRYAARIEAGGMEPEVVELEVVDEEEQ